jgi:hypothetical protein
MYIPDYFDVGYPGAIDSRMTKQSIVERDAIPAGVRFDGLATYVLSDLKTYQLQGGTTNSDWVDISGGGGALPPSTLLGDLYDVTVTTPVDYEQLLFNATTGEWYNWPEVFILNKLNGNVTTNSLVESVTVDAPLYNTEGGIFIVDGSNRVHLSITEDGGFTIINENTTTGDTSTIISQTPDGNVSIGDTVPDPDSGLTLDLPPDSLADWVMKVNAPAGKGGIQVNVDGWFDSGLQVNSASDGLVFDVNYMNSQIRAANVQLGTTSVPNHGDTTRDFTTNFDNYNMFVGSSGTDGFNVHGFGMTLQMVDGSGTFHLQDGVSQSATNFLGYVNVIENTNSNIGPVGSGYLTTEDYISAGSYFDGDLIFNHNTNVLSDVNSNICKTAEISVQTDEYVALEVDYVLSDNPEGMNKGKVLVHVGYDSSAESVEIIEVETEEFTWITDQMHVPSSDNSRLYYTSAELVQDGYVVVASYNPANPTELWSYMSSNLDVGTKIRIDGETVEYTVIENAGLETPPSFPEYSGYRCRCSPEFGLSGANRLYGYNQIKVYEVISEPDAGPPIPDGSTITFTGFDNQRFTAIYDGLSQENIYHIYSLTGVTVASPYSGLDTAIVTTVIEEIEVPSTGEAFITSIVDIKELTTGDTGVNWVLATSDTGSVKNAQLYATLNNTDTRLSYNCRFKKVGNPVLNILDNEPFGNSYPGGLNLIPALITTGGDSYWSKDGDDIYNLNVGNVGIGKTPATGRKLDVAGNMFTTGAVSIQKDSNSPTLELRGESGTSIFRVNSSDLPAPIFESTVDGDVFIGKIANTNRSAKLAVFGDLGTDYTAKFRSASSTTKGVSISAGSPGIDALTVSDYVGTEVMSITGDGILDVSSSITVAAGALLEVSSTAFTYKGNKVWVDGDTGNLGDLLDVTLSGLTINDTIKWDGVNWVPTPVTSGTTNLGYTSSSTQGEVTSDTGSNAILPLATAAIAGLLSPTEKTKLAQIAEGAEVNVQSDWTEAVDTADAYIINKPTSLSDFIDDLGTTAHISDSVIHVTQTDKDNWNATDSNVQSDWDVSDTGSDAYILNKPTLGEAASRDVDTTVTASSTNLITSGAVAVTNADLTVNPVSGFVRFGDDTIRLIQAGNTMNITDVPRLDSDGMLLISQTRPIVGGATNVYADATAVETDINGGTTIPSGDFIYTYDDKVMWIAAVDLSGPGFSFATAVTNQDLLDITTGANSYTQTQINDAFNNNSISAGDGLTGGGSLAFGGTTVTLNIDAGNGLNVNAVDGSAELDALVGSPSGTIYTP